MPLDCSTHQFASILNFHPKRRNFLLRCLLCWLLFQPVSNNGWRSDNSSSYRPRVLYFFYISLSIYFLFMSRVYSFLQFLCPNSLLILTLSSFLLLSKMRCFLFTFCLHFLKISSIYFLSF